MINSRLSKAKSIDVAVPKHIAVIMDGNGRWAKKRLLPRSAGHKAGAKAARELIESAVKFNLDVLTLFAFGYENWQRPDDEIEHLMDLFFTNLGKELTNFQKYNIQVKIIGDKSKFSKELQERIQMVEAETSTNTGLTLVIAASYSGRWDIIQAVQKLAKKVEQGDINVDSIDEVMLGQNMCSADLPDPDLLIRTSGEQRISNFLLWQLAYTEFYFTDKFWPEFSKKDLHAAIMFFQERKRRFGKINEQIAN